MSEARVSAETKRRVAGRARDRCEYCLCPLRFSADPFSIEHVVPRSAGGTSGESNLALSCQGCNNRKYTATHATDPVTGETVPLHNPREHGWAEHFAWSHDYSQIIGLTSSGRATVEKLQLNRAGVVNLRRLLRSAGEHPAEMVRV